MTAYGVVYATVSLSCTLPVFFAAVMSAFASPDVGQLLGVAAMLAYAVGMGAVLTTLALVVGLAGQAAAGRVRTWTRFVGRASGVLVLLAGAYVVWFGWVEWRTFRGEPVPAGPVEWVGACRPRPASSSRHSSRVAAAGVGGDGRRGQRHPVVMRRRSAQSSGS